MNRLSKQPARAGIRIPEPGPGRVFPWLASGRYLRQMVAVINAICNGKILVNVTMPDGTVEQARGQLLISDVNSELQVPVDLSNLPSTRGGTVSTGSGNDRGLWTPNPSSPYMTFDKVVLQAGTATGYYMSLMDNNGNAPDSGIGWIQLSSVQGVWL